MFFPTNLGGFHDTFESTSAHFINIFHPHLLKTTFSSQVPKPKVCDRLDQCMELSTVIRQCIGRDPGRGITETPW